MTAADVYPLFPLDDAMLNRIPVHWLLHFNDVLDAQKLHDALETLLAIGHWRKLTGRLTKTKGKSEIRVTPGQPLFGYYHDAQNISIDEHPLRLYLGDGSDGTCSIQSLTGDLRSFMTVSTTPKSFGGWINSDRPLLSVRITSFTDATLLGLTWPHSVMDALGGRSMLQAWSLVLAGKTSEVPAVLGTHDDILRKGLSKERCREDLALKKWQLKGLSAAGLIGRLIYGLIFFPRPDIRRIVLPQAAVSRLRAQAMEELPESSEKAFVSDNSAITGWFARTITLCEKKARPVTLIAVLNARFRLPEAKQEGGVYLQNMILPSYVFLSEDVVQQDVGHIALEQQDQMNKQATEAQVLAMIEMLYNASDAGKNPIFSLLLGKRNARLVAINNLTKVDVLRAVSFGPAVIGEIDKEMRDNPPGTPTDHTIHVPADKLGSGLCISGKDHAGNYRLIGKMKPACWKKIEEELYRI